MKKKVQVMLINSFAIENGRKKMIHLELNQNGIPKHTR